METSLRPVLGRLSEQQIEEIKFCLLLHATHRSENKVDDKPLRDNHRKIKSELIEKAVNAVTAQTINVLELGAGRGGDFGKWKRALKGRKRMNIVALEVDDASRQIAISVAKAINRNREKNINVSVRPQNLMDSQWSEIEENRRFTIISCQFAMNYFMETRATQNQFFNQVKQHMAEHRSIFIATYVDSQPLEALLTSSPIPGENTILRPGLFIYNDPGTDGYLFRLLSRPNNRAGYRTNYFDITAATVAGREYKISEATIREHFPDREYDVEIQPFDESRSGDLGFASKLYYTLYIQKKR